MTKPPPAGPAHLQVQIVTSPKNGVILMLTHDGAMLPSTVRQATLTGGQGGVTLDIAGNNVQFKDGTEIIAFPLRNKIHDVWEMMATYPALNLTLGNRVFSFPTDGWHENLSWFETCLRQIKPQGG